MTNRTIHIKELNKVFSSIKTPAEAGAFLEDMLTPQEIESIAERWQLLKLLAQGEPQRSIKSALGVSISKITRGSKVLTYGTGGFKKIYNRLK